MARPKKYNADYFSHDADMRNDSKVLSIRNKFGHVGYSVWVMLLESLSNKDGFVLEWNDLDIEIMSGDFRVEVEELESIISYLLKLKLIVIKGKTLYCPKLIKRFEPLLTERERKRNGVMARNNPDDTELRQDKPVRYPQSKVKDSKVKETKVNLSLKKEREKKKNLPPLEIKNSLNLENPKIEDVMNKFGEINKTEKLGFDNDWLKLQSISLFDFYSKSDWHYGKGKEKVESLDKVVKSWLAKEYKKIVNYNQTVKPVPMESFNIEPINGVENTSKNIGGHKF